MSIFHRDPTRPVAVVDERTYRQAQRIAADRLEAGDYVRAVSAMTAMCCWLRYEVRTGRKSKRLERAARLERLEADKEACWATMRGEG